MTFREKLQEECPEVCGTDYVGGCFWCPCSYEYEPNSCGLCKNDPGNERMITEDELRELCTKCWDRECPETKCRYCGGTLSEVRMHNGRRLQHCYSCHFEFYLD